MYKEEPLSDTNKNVLLLVVFYETVHGALHNITYRKP